jgi:hypothetical protein
MKITDKCTFFECNNKKNKLFYKGILLHKWSQVSIVDIMTMLQAGWSGVCILAGARMLSSGKCPEWLRGPPSLLFSEYQNFSWM